MGDRGRRGLAVVVAVVATLVAVPVAGASPGVPGCRPGRVTTEELPTLGGARAWPVDVNDHGEAVGGSGMADHSSIHAVLWRRGGAVDLVPALRPSLSQALAVNDRGDVLVRLVGPERFGIHLWSRGRLVDVVPDDPDARGVLLGEEGEVVVARPGRLDLWRDGTVTAIAAWGPGEHLVATDVNDRGEVVGYEVGAGPGPRISPWYWHDGSFRDLPVPAGFQDVMAIRIDRAGRILLNASKVVGEPGEVVETALVRDGGTTTELPWPPGAVWGVRGIDMNRHGDVVGQVWMVDRHRRGFLWRDGRIVDLDAAGRHDVQVEPVAISDRGHVTGLRYDPGSDGFLWWCGRMVELAPGPASSAYPVAINARGQVASQGSRDDRGPLAMLSTPTHP